MPLLELRGISKQFDAVRALTGVDLTVESGEVLALVGDNGAGKSTLIKIISGTFPPDAGEIRFEGGQVTIASPEVAKRLGIETVYQDLALFEHGDVTANLFAGREMTRRLLGVIPVLDEARMRRFTQEALARLRIQIPGIGRSMKWLSGGQRQSVAIGRAIAFGTKLVIMDEPTAALGAVEVTKVLELVRSLKARGLSVIVISHNLQHVFSVADRMAVLRQGELVGVVRPAETTSEAIVLLMVGGDRVGASA